MDYTIIKNELKYILQGESPNSQGATIQAAAHYLRKSTQTSAMAKNYQPSREEETKKLIEYINANNLWNCDIPFDAFISQGAEQRVYIQNEQKVLKLNDAIYYKYWVDYFDNL